LSNQAAKFVNVGHFSFCMVIPVNLWNTPIVGSAAGVAVVAFGFGISPGSRPPPGETSDVEAIGVDSTDVAVVEALVTTADLAGVAVGVDLADVLDAFVLVVDKPNIELRSTLYLEWAMSHCSRCLSFGALSPVKRTPVSEWTTWMLVSLGSADNASNSGNDSDVNGF
jgi:hypothetical protein